MGKLYVVATPIGNLSDMSERAKLTLEQVDFIAAEDTRVSVKILNHLGISKPLISYFEHNKREKGEEIVARIENGEDCAIVTDAGTPAISDPGEDLVSLCGERNIEVIAVPGACAVIAALSVCGLPTGRWCFEGFLSTAKKSRREHLEELKTEKRTMVFYEAPHKLRSTLLDLYDALGDRRIVLCREITKIYEETLRFTLKEAINYYEEVNPKGEFVLVIEGCEEKPQEEYSIDEALEFVGNLIGDMTLKDAVKKVSGQFGIKKNTLYNEALKMYKGE